MKNAIRITGAAQNNLKNLSAGIPCNSITVITGVSGSGKSSLAFDTLYAEGQRRYIESFSAYARQFMERMDKPVVERIEGILPAIAINQTNPVKSSRSTLGTLTEINDYIKLLFPKLSSLYCSTCARPVTKDTAQSVAHHLMSGYRGLQCLMTFPFILADRTHISLEEVEEGLRRQGFFRVYINGEICTLSTELLSEHSNAPLYLLVDRLDIHDNNKKRIIDSLEMSFKFGKGHTSIFFDKSDLPQLQFSSSFHCAHCDISYSRPTANLFSFNSALGACEYCNGFGKTIAVDMDAVIPDHSLSLQNDAVKPWSTPSYRDAYHDLLAFCKSKSIPVDVPFGDLSPEQQAAVKEGDGQFYGIKGFFEWLETKTYKMHIRVLLSKYRAYETCSRCQGTRFKPETLLYRINGKTIADLYAMNIESLLEFCTGLTHSAPGEKTVQVLLNEITSRVKYLSKVGLGYLTLDRQSRTLSGGEVERACLTTALGSNLVNTLYILDEPSIGLHPRDTYMLMGLLYGLRDLGNTIVVVEHDPDIIRSSDKVIDLGPSSGEEGGRIVFAGSPKALERNTDSLTGQYLSGSLTIPVPKRRRIPDESSLLVIAGANIHNLKNISIHIPLGVLTCITGVSGSGKSTLLEEVIYASLAKRGGNVSLCYFDGTDPPENTVFMDQSPIGKTPRSNPVTYMKMFDTVRCLFAETALAKERGYTPSLFSFNSSGGRCEHCRGDGFEKIEMQFLADVYVPCSSCRGSRYSVEILDVRYKGKNIHEVLQLTVSEAREFFAETPKAEFPLRILEMVGLGYLRLGQPSNTLSGGESQRLRLASFIRRGASGKTLFLFDEPTTGLHYDDIAKLLMIFDFLLKHGHSIVIVEHNMEIIKSADHIIDLGPEGGNKGGNVVFQGSPEAAARVLSSPTGVYVRKALAGDLPAPNTAKAAQTSPSAREGADTIQVVGAREHNLKNLSIAIPRDTIVVITGLSGSGKSTLAFDILFAEGQRRFLETLSPYARQYVHQLKRPDVDTIRGLPPTIAIEQQFSRGGKKSTVATVTEIYHYLRLLFAKAGKQHCSGCGKALSVQTPQNIAADISAAFAGDRIMLLAPQVKGRKGLHKNIIQKARKDGYSKIRIDGNIVRLQNIFAVKRYHEHRLEIITAELALAETTSTQIQEAVNTALGLGHGELIVLGHDNTEKFYSTHYYCPSCRISVGDLDPRLFSFNSIHGACPACSGTGSTTCLAPELLVADSKKSIRQGAIPPLATSPLSPAAKKRLLTHIEEKGKFSLDTPVCRLSKARYQSLFYGKRSFDGLIAMFSSPTLQRKAEWADYVRQFMRTAACPDCHGTRINAAARSVLIEGKCIADLTQMTPGALKTFLAALDGDERHCAVVGPILEELMPKLDLLEKAGLSYLRLDRGADTLSGGESQRIRLAAQIATNLRGIAYVLDEPTVGLHPHDTGNLISIVQDLKSKGNSVIIVEHDDATIRQADCIIDLGPGGGANGGSIVAAGSVDDILNSPASATGTYLAGKRNSPSRSQPRSLAGCRYLLVRGASEHNLKKITARFPLRRLTVVTGVSGAGKTTLVRETLYKGLRKKLGSYHGPCGTHERISGHTHIKRVLEIDQTPIGKTPRSIPATYVGFYDALRALFAQVPEAKIRGYSAARFSFNLKGGRCEKCSGQGKIKVAMSFLPDMYVDCDTCRGTRFNDETTAVLFKDKSIAQVLAMTVEEACLFFSGIPDIQKPLSFLQKMGLGYLTLGQPSPTLSGGEAQRIKIAAELCKKSQGRSCYVLDEPTTGLHAADIEKLMEVLQALVDLGNTVVVIEHNLEVIRQADNIIDLGPDGGDAGGRIIASGPPRAVAFGCSTDSHTGAYLKDYILRLETRNKKLAM